MRDLLLLIERLIVGNYSSSGIDFPFVTLETAAQVVNSQSHVYGQLGTINESIRLGCDRRLEGTYDIYVQYSSTVGRYKVYEVADYFSTLFLANPYLNEKGTWVRFLNTVEYTEVRPVNDRNIFLISRQIQAGVQI